MIVFSYLLQNLNEISMKGSEPEQASEDSSMAAVTHLFMQFINAVDELGDLSF